MTDAGFDAVVLAGGRSSRMAGDDKTRLVVGDTSLLDRVLSAVSVARSVVVVGEQRPTTAPVTWTREDPPGGGPAAGAAAGLSLVTAPVVVLLAGDLPFVTADTVAALVASVDGDGAVLTDAGGRPQWLCSVWLASSLRGAQLAPGSSLHATLGELRFATVAATGDPPVWLDCDTPDDLQRARELT
jgi:molybdopterin-guanine dinucleotide biosynthesis protein A